MVFKPFAEKLQFNESIIETLKKNEREEGLGETT
jgi:hypothetical protein